MKNWKFFAVLGRKHVYGYLAATDFDAAVIEIKRRWPGCALQSLLCQKAVSSKSNGSGITQPSTPDSSGTITPGPTAK